MTPEDKELLLKDVSARLPYGVMIYGKFPYSNGDVIVVEEKDEKLNVSVIDWIENGIEDVKPYLRPMSSMTEKEKEELIGCLGLGEYAKYFKVAKDGGIETSNINDLHYVYFGTNSTSRYTDWLNANHFDYRGLIGKGLALEAPEGMYNV